MPSGGEVRVGAFAATGPSAPAGVFGLAGESLLDVSFVAAGPSVLGASLSGGMLISLGCGNPKNEKWRKMALLQNYSSPQLQP